MNKIGDVCPHCEEDKLVLIKGNEPYNIDHLQCPSCDSTYNLEENMNKVIECKGCLDCPFRYDDYSPDSLGKDTVVVCNLAHFLKLPLYLVKSYDSWSEDDVNFTIETPIWCPLKREDITVKL